MQIPEQTAALPEEHREAIIDAADEWAQYVTEDHAPLTLRAHMQLALAALATKPAGAADSTEPVASNWHRHHVAVEKAALQMVRNALRTDAEAGRSVRSEMLAMLDEATREIPAPIAAEAVPPASSERPVAFHVSRPECRGGRWLVRAEYSSQEDATRAEEWLIGLRAASNAAEPAGGEAVTLCARIMRLVDEYHEHPHRNTRYAIRAALMDEWAPTRATPPQAVPAGLSDAQRMDALRENSWDLRCVDIPTGQGDADIHWRVVAHHMGEPHEREVGYAHTDDPREAIDAALAASAPGAPDLAQPQQGTGSGS